MHAIPAGDPGAAARLHTVLAASLDSEAAASAADRSRVAQHICTPPIRDGAPRGRLLARPKPMPDFGAGDVEPAGGDDDRATPPQTRRDETSRTETDRAELIRRVTYQDEAALAARTTRWRAVCTRSRRRHASSRDCGGSRRRAVAALRLVLGADPAPGGAP